MIDGLVLVTRVPVERDHRDLGRVLILRDRSDLDDLARELGCSRSACPTAAGPPSSAGSQRR